MDKKDKIQKQRTLVLIKPDGVARGLMGEIIKRFEKVGLKIVGLKMLVPDKKLAEKHYPVTEEWFKKVGSNTINACPKYGFQAKEVIGTDDPIEIGKKVHQWNIDFLTSGPVLAMVLEGVHALEVARKIAGETVPLLAAPGTIRGDLTSISAISVNLKNNTLYNLVHTSGNDDEAKKEIALWFSEKEILKYRRTEEDYIF